MTATFTWIPDLRPRLNEKPDVSVVKFSGYEQRTGNCLSSNLQTRDLSFTGRGLAESDAIIAFLRVQGAIEAFYYTHPRDIQRLYVCREWNQDEGEVTADIQVRFEEVLG